MILIINIIKKKEKKQEMETELEIKLETKYELVEQPLEYKVNLYPHQLHSIWRMEFYEKHRYNNKSNNTVFTRFAVNADPTGYGKTISMIGLIVRDKMEWNLNEFDVYEIKENCHSYLMERSSTMKIKRVKPTLILCDQSLISQWESELKKTNLDIHVISESYFTAKNESFTATCPANESNDTRTNILDKDILNKDVIVVSTILFNKFSFSLYGKYKEISWKRLIFDEPSNVRVPSMATFYCGFLWLVTATPENIHNNHVRCTGSYMSKIVKDMDKVYNNIKIKNNINFIKQSILMPPTTYITHYCYSSLRTIYSSLSDKLKEMLDANNIKGAIHLLGGSQTDNIFELLTKNKTLRIKALDALLQYHENMLAQNYSIHSKKIEELTKQKEQVENELKTINERFKDILNQNCSICFDKINEPLLEPNCQNIFCAECLLTWLKSKRTCPLCRHEINPSELSYIKVNDENEEQKEIKIHETNEKYEKCTKDEMIVKIIKEKKNGKFIIFSNYFESFKTIKKILKENDIKFVEIKGAKSTIDENIKKFKTGDDIQAIFLNSKFNGSGLNLQEATDIIMYHEMSECLTTQVIGRANRIGRKIPLTVHLLMYREV